MKDLISIHNNRVVAVTPVTAENLEATRQYFLKQGMIVLQGTARIGDHYDPKTSKFTAPTETEQLLSSGIFVKIEENWKLSKLAFKNRFPKAKWIAAKQAASTDPELDYFFDSFDLAQYIDLKSADTIDNVKMFGTDAVPDECKLSTAEIAAILETPPKSGELA